MKKRWMIKHKETIILFVLSYLVIFSSTGTGVEKELTLLNIIELAIQNNQSYQLAVAEYEYHRARETYEGRNRPIITFTSTPVAYRNEEIQRPDGEIYARYDLTDNLRVEADLFFALHEEGMDFDSRIMASYSSRLFVPTLSIDKEYEVLSPEEVLETRKNQLVLEVMHNYYQLLKNNNFVEIQRKELEIAIHRWNRARAQKHPKTDILHTKTEADRKREELNKALDAVRSAREDMERIVGLPISSIEIIPHYPPYNPVEPVLEIWVQAAIQSSAQVHDLRRRLYDAEVQLGEALIDHGWDVTVNLSHEWRHDLSTDRESPLTGQDTRGSIVFSRSLYPPSSSLLLQELEIAVKRAELGLETEEKSVKRRMEDLYRRAITLEERIYHLEERILEGEESLKREIVRVEAGLSTPLHQKEVELVLAQLMTELEHAYWDHHLTRWEIKVLSGWSSVEDDCLRTFLQ